MILGLSEYMLSLAHASRAARNAGPDPVVIPRASDLAMPPEEPDELIPADLPAAALMSFLPTGVRYPEGHDSAGPVVEGRCAVCHGPSERLAPIQPPWLACPDCRELVASEFCPPKWRKTA